MTISVFDRLEIIVEKVEIAGYHHFLICPQCFRERSLSGSLKTGLCGKELVLNTIKKKVETFFLEKSILAYLEITINEQLFLWQRRFQQWSYCKGKQSRESGKLRRDTHRVEKKFKKKGGGDGGELGL